MKLQLLEWLLCPRCGNGDLSCRDPVQGSGEIRRARLSCGCGATYPVRGGVVDLTLPGPEMEQARAHAWREVQQSSGLIHDDVSLLAYEAGFRDLPSSEAHRYPWGTHLNLDRALERMAPGPGRRVLDVGAGVTWTSARLAALGADVVATDLLEEPYAGLASADVFMRERGLHFERVLAPMERQPFRDGSFHHVLFHSAIHHADRLEPTLAEAARVLEPGGSVLLVNEPVGSPGGVFGGAFGRQQEEAGEHVHSLRAYIHGLRAAGLEPQILYPPGLGARLDALAEGHALGPATSRGQALKYGLVRLGLRLWRHSPSFRRLFETRLYRPALSLFGQFLLAEAQKRS